MKKEQFSDLEWDRLASASARTGLSRPKLWPAVVRGDILGSHIKKPGTSKDVWLVNLRSHDPSRVRMPVLRLVSRRTPTKHKTHPLEFQGIMIKQLTLLITLASLTIAMA